MNITILKRITLARPLFFFALMVASLGLQTASGNEYLGVLTELTNPESEIAKKLELTEQQRLQLKQLSTKRVGSALGLAAQLNEVPKSEQGQLMAKFVAESERMALEVLNPEQQAKLVKLRVQWIGLTSLVEEDIAKALNLTDGQKQVVADWREQVRAAKKANNEDKVKPQADRAIRRELSDTQYSAWQFMAGLITEKPAAAPMPPEPKVDAPASGGATSGRAGSVAAMTPEQVSRMPIEKIELELNFQKQPWGDVIKWLADQADMSVQSELIPPGSFTYRDLSRKYTVPETLDLMNGYLLDSGFTLFRSGRLLRCVNFEENQKILGELITEIADLVPVEDLKSKKYGRYEPVKVLFTLKRLDPESIKEEVKELLSIQGTVKAFSTSGQMQVTDMAGNVRAVAEFIERAEDPMSARGAAVQSIPLKVINAEEILAVARPLLELQDGANVSANIKISTNTFGTVIYAKGDMDKIQILKDLVEQMDKAPQDAGKPVTYEPAYIGRHSVQGLDIQLAYEVISQLLAGTPDVRLAKDDASKQLILMGRKADHETVKTTLDSLAGQKSDFQVIQLERLDPQMAIAAVKKFFGLSDKPSADSGEPVIDGDLMARQVWVKGSEEQVQRIRNLIEELEKNAKSTKNIWGANLRMLPSGGGSADAIKQAEVLWQQMYGKTNPIVRDNTESFSTGGLKSKSYAPPKKPREDSEQDADAEKEPAKADQVNPVPAAPAPKVSKGSVTQKQPKRSAVKGKFVSTQDETAEVKASDEESQAPIIISDGPGGLMIRCDDTEALERFENLLRMIMEQSNLGGDKPEVVYLQNIKAAAAKELLENVLSGAASSGGSSGGMLGDMATSVLGGFGGGMLGSLLGGGGGGSTGAGSGSSAGLATGDYSIVADPRLNALFVSASNQDRMLIEQILKVIDQPESPFPIETRGTTEMIPVITQDASAVLTTVKAVFGDRIEGNATRGGGGAGGQPNPAEIVQAMRSAMGGAGGRRGGANSELTEPKIAVSADTFTNSLIVVAQPQQIEEVRKLVTMIDEAGEGEMEDVVVIPIPDGVGSIGLADSLKRVLGPKAQTNTSGTQPTSTTGATDADANRRRAEAMQGLMQMQRGGQTGGFGTGNRGVGGQTGGFGGQGGGNRGQGGFGGGQTGGGNRTQGGRTGGR